MNSVTSADIKAASFAALDVSKLSERQRDLYEVLVAEHLAGVVALTRRELLEAHNRRLPDKAVAINCVTAPVGSLLASKVFEDAGSRPCSLPPHRLAKTVRVAARQARLVD